MSRELPSLSPPSTGDVIAGLSVALVAIPQSLAYAGLAGMPAQYGLFATALPSLLAAAFVSSRYLQTGPVALTALLTFGALSTLATPESADYIALAALLALLVGAMRVVLGLVRWGRIAYLLSEPVLMGFTTGAAVLIISSQLPKLFDVTPTGDGVLGNAWEALTSPGEWRPSALLFAAMTWVAMFGGRRLHKVFPGVLVAVVVAIVISSVMEYGGSVVGQLDGGFLSLQFDFPWDRTLDLLLPAAAIALVGFAEPSSIARQFAAEERTPWDANREMLSQGVANLASAVSGAFPVGGSFSRSSLNRLAGATSPWAGAITGAIVLLALPFTPVLETLPQAVLGAVVVGAVFKLVQIPQLVALARASSLQYGVAFGTFVATLVSAPRVERGVLVGIGLAIAAHLYREMTVSTPSVRTGSTLRVTPQGVLWFATVPAVERLIRSELAAEADLTAVELDLSAVGRLDYGGAAALARITDELSAGGVAVRVVNVRPGSARAVRIHMSDISDS